MANCCRIVVQTRSNNVWFVGTEAHARIAEFTYVTLVRAAEQLATEAYDAFFKECRLDGDVTRARGFRSAWLRSFVYRISERLQESRRQTIESAAALAPEAQRADITQSALVRLDRAKKRVDDFIENEYKKKASAIMGRDSWHDEGSRRGRAAADRVQIGKPVATQRRNAVGG